MDLITHAVLGAVTGEWMLGKRLGNRALVWGALAGLLPDLDGIVTPFLDSAANLWWLRGPSHSLLVMIAASWLLSSWLAKLWKRDKISRARTAGFIFAAWSTHLLIDCFAAGGGAALFWPFPVKRVALGFMDGFDPLFALPMAVALVRLAFLTTKKQMPRRRRLNGWGTGLAASYVLFCAAMKFTAAAGFEADLARRGVVFNRRMEAPAGFSGLLWRSVVDRGDEFWVGYRSIFDSHASPVRWTVYPKGTEALNGLQNLSEVRALMDFTDGWWLARTHVQGAWLGDLRTGETRTWGDKKGVVDSRLAFAWDILPGGRGDRLRPLHPTRADSRWPIARKSSRVFGNHAAWEANPRLAGVTGSLPEFLAVKD